MTILYSAKYLIPVSTPPLEYGAIAVRDGRIQAVGHLRELQKAAAGAELVDFGDAVLLPPLINAHTHLELTDFPAWAGELGESADPDDFVGWIEKVIRVKRGIAPARFTAAVEHGIAASLAAGTGAVGDIISSFDARTPHRTSPLRGRLFFEAVGRQAEPTRRLRERITALVDEGACGRLTPGVAPHAPYSIAENYLEDLFRFAEQRQLPCTMHLAESAEECRFLAEATGPLAERLYPLVGWRELVPAGTGLSPVGYLAEHGGLIPGNLLVHGVQVDDRDVERLAVAGAPLVVCPRSNHRLGVGQAPIAQYRRHRVRLALGTDSLASNDSLSVWDEIAFARKTWGPALHPATLVEMATLGGSDVLGLRGEIGALQYGWGCHFQVLNATDLNSPGQLYEFLTAPGRTADLRHLYLDGIDRLPSA